MKKTVRVKDASGNTIASQEIDSDDEGIPAEAVLEEGETMEVLESSDGSVSKSSDGSTVGIQLPDGDEEISAVAVLDEDGEEGAKSVELFTDASGNTIASAHIGPDSEDGIPCEGCVEED